MISQRTKMYLIRSLAGAPTVLKALFDGTNDDVYDHVYDANRFTLREALAHIADWEPIFLGRLTQLKSEDHPVLQGIDEGEWSKAHNHSQSDPKLSLQQYAAGRQKLIAFVSELTDDDWLRRGLHTEAGETTMTDQLVMIAAHDNYHLLQAAEWLH